MYIKKEIDFNDLLDLCWSGAINTLEEVDEAGAGDSLMMLLEENFDDDVPDIGYINDILWFESDWILETLGIVKPEDENEDEEEDLHQTLNDIDWMSYDTFDDYCNNTSCEYCPFDTMENIKTQSDCKTAFESCFDTAYAEDDNE